jgi:hypothetical protein
VVHLADIQQRRLVPLSDITPPRPGKGPLVDGAERLGVLSVHAPSLTPAVLRHGMALAALLAMMITSTRAYQDSFVRRTRTNPMALPAEMLRAFLPPRTIGTGHVVSTAVLEPAHEIGGDAFDHSLTETTLHATVLDAMGHDLAPSGTLRWSDCGHPTPLLIRDQRLLVEVTEARGSDGAEFGLEQFADYIIRATAAGEPAPETLRRLIHSVLDSSTSRLRDDATILMFEWSRPPR